LADLFEEHKNICVCADDSDLRVKNMDTINKNLLDSSLEGGVKVNELVNI
jgi:nickel-dependent lactate racemase